MRIPPSATRALTVFGLAAAAAAVTAVGLAGPATAADCQTTTYWNTDGVTLAAGATAVVTNDGLVLTTPVREDHAAKATFKVTLATPVALADVKKLSYKTRKTDADVEGNNDAAIASYDLYLSIEGKLTTLIYEPYYQIVGNPARNTTQVWNVDEGKFWASNPAAVEGLPPIAGGGGSYAGNKTVAQILADNPQAKVLGYGSHQGTSNDGTISRINDLKFSTKSSCMTHVWDASKKPSPSPSSSSASPSPSSSATPAATLTATHPVPGASSLPVTGTPVSSATWFGTSLVGIGGALVTVLYWVSRRRRVHFTAE